MEAFLTHAPLIALLFFFGAFAGVMVYVLRPGARKQLEQHAEIPLKEDDHGGH